MGPLGAVAVGDSLLTGADDIVPQLLQFFVEETARVDATGIGLRRAGLGGCWRGPRTGSAARSRSGGR